MCVNFRRKKFPRSAPRCTRRIVSLSSRGIVIRLERPNTPGSLLRPSSHFLPSVPRNPSLPSPNLSLSFSLSSHAFDRARFTVDEISHGGTQRENICTPKAPRCRPVERLRVYGYISVYRYRSPYPRITRCIFITIANTRRRATRAVN